MQRRHRGFSPKTSLRSIWRRRSSTPALIANRWRPGALIWQLLATYTTLEIGDLHPSGVMRLIAGVESLNGLVLIGWSASCTHLTMEELWGRGGSEKGA